MRFGIDFGATAEKAGFTGKAGEAFVLTLPVLHPGDARAATWAELPSSVILIGTGDGSAQEHRRAGAKLARVARGKGRVTVSSGTDPAAAEALVEGYLLGAYQPVKYPLATSRTDQPAAKKPNGRHNSSRSYGSGSAESRNEPERDQRSGDLTLLGSYDLKAIDRAVILARATAWARDLVNWPSNWKTPGSLAAKAAAEAAKRQSVQFTEMGPEQLKQAGLNAILAVGGAAWQGQAADPERGPRLVTVTYTPTKAKGARHIVIVGKGITFDSGGLDLKPPVGMATMKTDMAGGATALAAVLAAADLGLPAKVTALVPLAQNSLGAASYRPSDVIETYGGLSVEVGDTDAEGRLVLADGLAYAQANLKPHYLIDIATLTGAAKLALGGRLGALMTPDDALAARIEHAGAEQGEEWWRLPLADVYKEALTTPNAAINSIGRPGTGAGAITAGLFLERFAGTERWAHLDIAGPARAGDGQEWTAPGGTGFGVRTLAALVERLA
jgi:leucyl aminopeptidase